MSRPKGLPKSGGRQKGTTNHFTRGVVDVRAKMAKLGFDPFEAMGKMATGSIPCAGCGQSGHDHNGKPCAWCRGTGTETVEREIRARMAAELAKYVSPQLRATEISGPDGGPALVTVINLGGKGGDGA